MEPFYSHTLVACVCNLSHYTTIKHVIYRNNHTYTVHKFSYKSSERIRGGKLYVVDTAFISNRPHTFSLQNMGWRLENVVLVELLHRIGRRYADVFYYRDRTFEVDFLVAKGGVVESLYQVCYDMSDAKTRKREINGLLQGARKFHCSDLTIITFSQAETIIAEDQTIHVIPAPHWLSIVH